MILFFSKGWRFYFIYFYFPFIFLLCAACKASADYIDIKVDIKNTFSLNKEVFGVHGEMLWSPVRYEDPLLADYYLDLGFTSIRFPGGTTANYYLSQSRNFGCDKSIPKSSRSAKRVIAFNNALAVGERTYSTEDFTKFIKRTHTDFTLVLNIFCDGVNDALQWIKEFSDLGVKVDQVELGNELYYKEYNWVFKKPDNYIKLANKFSAEIKKYDPNIKIGYIASSSVFQSEHYPDVARMHKSKHHDYGLKLDYLSATSRASNILVTHFYSDIGISKVGGFFGLPGNEEIYKNAISHFDGRSKDAITYFEKLGLNKEIWITEWGVLFYGDTRKFEKDFQHSIFNALFMANGLITFVNSKDVQKAYYHNLPSFLPYKDGYIKSIFNVSAIKLFKQPVAEALGVNYTKVNGMPTRDSHNRKFPGVSDDLSIVYFKGVNHDSLIVVNKFDNDYIVSSLKSFSEDMLVPVAVEQITKDSSDIKKLSDIRKIILPGYSITKITINRP